MAPNTPAGVFVQSASGEPTPQLMADKRAPTVIVWRNVILFAYLHAAALYGAYLVFTSAKLLTTVFAYLLYVCGGLGITAGVHRLWAHKAYKAKTPLKIILAIFNTLAFQNSIYEWSRDHRVHHKFSDTDADPHNAARGFFFCHIGWLFVRKQPEVIRKGRTIDLTDLERDPVVAFQKKYYMILMPMICFVLPTVVPVYLWGETWNNAWYVSLLRYAFTLNITWCVNSVAHFFGSKPYDKFINPAQNLFVAVFALGEGWHNYHHTFPWDYKTAELGNYRANFTTLFIDFFAKIGWAYELKSVSSDLIAKRALRTGDGSHSSAGTPAVADAMPLLPPHELLDNPVWGWDDRDMPEDDRREAIVSEPHLHSS